MTANSQPGGVSDSTAQKRKQTCEHCRHWTATGTEAFYRVGKCQHPHPALGGAMVDYANVAEWASCYQWARRVRKARRLKAG